MVLKIVMLLFLMLVSGCTTPTPRWRDDALSRFNNVVRSGSQSYAPEETDNIRQTLELAESFFQDRLIEDADRLYQLSCQKSQLLYRSLVLSKVRQGSALLVDSGKDNLPVEVSIASEPVSIREILHQAAKDEDLSLSDLPELIQEQAPPNYEPGAGQAPLSAISKIEEPVAAAAPSLGAPKRLDQPPPSVPPTPKRTQLKAKAKDLTAASASGPGPAGTTIYLTFDDGPSRLTLPIASYLKAEGVAATFFVLGNNIKGHQSTVRATVAMGHRVGNHTLSHDLRKLNASFRQDVSEVGRTAAMIDKLGGDGRLVRIPFGASTKTMISRVASEGGQIFDWDINSYDSTRRGSKDHAFIERTVLSKLAKSGKRHIILLFHDGAGHESTLTAIRNLVPVLKAKGYRFGLLSRSERIAKSEHAKANQ